MNKFRLIQQICEKIPQDKVQKVDTNNSIYNAGYIQGQQDLAKQILDLVYPEVPKNDPKGAFGF